ncbi:MAG: hypothetical protein QXR92_05630 [Fervidicoccaceae archaeon]
MEKIAREGKALFFIPISPSFMRRDGKIEPSWMPFFYNPYSVLNRDLTVLAIRAYRRKEGRIRTFVEPLSGICVRSIRVLLEASEEETMAYASDINPLAIEQCRRNAELNHLRTRMFAERNDARLFLLSLDSNGVPVDSIDIDPYGSPIYYFESALKAIGKKGIVSVTATDLGALTGRYKDVALRRYGSNLTRTQFSREVGTRVLIGSFVRTSSYLDRAAHPLFSFYHEHFLKVLFLVRRERNGATRAMEKLGYLCINEEGGISSIINLNDFGTDECKKAIGPLWIDNIWNEEFTEQMKNELKDSQYLSSELKRTLSLIEREIKVNSIGYYRIDEVCSAMRKNIPPFSVLINELEKMGYRASRTHFDKRGIRTNAPLEDLKRAIEEASSRL